MSGHSGFVSKEELDLIVYEEISRPLGKPAEVRVYRDNCNSGTEVFCNGRLLQAHSNCKLKDLIMEMKREGTLLKHFQKPAMFREGI